MTRWLIPLFVYLGYALFPLYLLPSGLPQVSDAVLAVFIVLTFIYLLMSNTRIRPLPVEWTLLVLVVVVVQLSWTVILQTLGIIHHVFFWVFNYLICFCLYIFINKEPQKYLNIIYKAVSTALIISFIGIFIFKGLGGRVTGFFNNPNQLAYFSLISLVIVSYFKDFKLNNIFHIFILIVGVLSILLSASLGASISLVFLVVSYLLKNLSFRRMMHIIIAVPLLVGMVSFLGGERLVENVNNRMARFDTKVANVESERNYDRILIHSELVLLGAGEGQYLRFNDYSALEIHSSFGNLLFSYGLLSFVLFSILLIRIIINLPLAYSISLFAPLAYSMTHMGLRSVYFWLLITLCFYIARSIDDFSRRAIMQTAN